jgi:hypothetical protein
MLGGGGWNKHSGPYQMANGNIWVSAAKDHDSSCAGGISDDVQPFKDNVCIGQFSGISEEGAMSKGFNSTAAGRWSGNNSFYTMPLHSNVTVNGEPLAQAQATGLELGSTAHDFATSLGTEGVLAMTRQLLSIASRGQQDYANE